MLFASHIFAASDTDSLVQGIVSNDCVIEPNRLVEVSSSVSGVMDILKVKRGDFVKKGQILANLKSRIERATVALARARAERDQAIKAKTARSEFANRRLERNKELYRKKLISEQVVDEAETEALLAELELGEFLENRIIAGLELQRALESLEIRTIRSPFDGVVIDVSVVPGESIENRPLLKIASIDPLNVEVIAPVQLYGKIKKGMKARVIPEEPIGGQYAAKVVIVDQVIDAASGTFGIRLELPNHKFKIPAGLRCQVQFPGLKGVTSTKAATPIEADKIKFFSQ
ncbi:MAG: efflux RND transporter periplasmic adaptor subunit [Gammaproteobacteria bacterium]